MQSPSPSVMAVRNAVLPVRVERLGSAPAFKSFDTSWMCPPAAAATNAFSPSNSYAYDSTARGTRYKEEGRGERIEYSTCVYACVCVRSDSDDDDDGRINIQANSYKKMNVRVWREGCRIGWRREGGGWGRMECEAIDT